MLKSNDVSLSVTGKDSFAIVGDLSFETVPTLIEDGLKVLHDFSGNTVTIDFAKVGKSNSASIALLLAWLRFANKKKMTLHFAHIPSQLLQIIHLVGIEKAIPLLGE